MNTLEKIDDLINQATEDRSNFYTEKVLRELKDEFVKVWNEIDSYQQNEDEINVALKFWPKHTHQDRLDKIKELLEE